MKPSTILIIVLSIALVIMGYRELDSRGTKQQLQIELDSLLNEAQHLQTLQEISSAHIGDLELQITIQDQVLQNREREAVEAKQIANEYRNKYNSIKFVVYQPDSLEMELKKLYKSWK